VVLVVDARKFNFENLDQALAQLRAAGANVVGVVLNRARRPKMSSEYRFDRPDNPEEAAVRPSVRLRSAMDRLRGLAPSG
jgi:Mrp family chromosome partitioning ATPase